MSNPASQKIMSKGEEALVATYPAPILKLLKKGWDTLLKEWTGQDSMIDKGKTTTFILNDYPVIVPTNFNKLFSIATPGNPTMQMAGDILGLTLTTVVAYRLHEYIQNDMPNYYPEYYDASTELFYHAGALEEYVRDPENYSEGWIVLPRDRKAFLALVDKKIFATH